MKRTFHLLLIHQYFATHDDSGGTRHYELLVPLVSHGNRATVLVGNRDFSTDRKVQSKKSEGIDIRRCWTLPGQQNSYIWRIFVFISFFLSSLLASVCVRSADVVIATSPPLPVAIVGLIIARIRRIPFVLEIRDLWPDFGVELGVIKNKTLIWLARKIESLAYRNADCVIVNSPGYINHVRERGAKRIEVIPNGVDCSFFTINRVVEERALELRTTWNACEKFVLIYTGAMRKANNLSVLLHAMKLIEVDDILMVFVGNGNERDGLRELAESLQLKNVLFKETVKKSEMPAVLAAADCGVGCLAPIPLFTMPYPNKVFDYMAAGRPVLCAIDGEIRKVVEKSECGIYASAQSPSDISKAIVKIASDKRGADQLGQNGKYFVQEYFDRGLQAKQLENLLRQVVEGELNGHFVDE